MYSTKQLIKAVLGITAAGIMICAPASAANAVINGSLEDLNAQWSDSGGNYKALGANSTSVAAWKVTGATVGEIVWGKSTTSDNHDAPDGLYFLDLSGYGSTAAGGVEQSLVLNAGSTYDFSIDIFGALPSVTVGSTNVSLGTFTSFNVGADTWNRYTASFVADSSNPLLSISNVSFGADLHFIDNVVITESGTPEPGTILLFGSGLAIMVGARFRGRCRPGR